MLGVGIARLAGWTSPEWGGHDQPFWTIIGNGPSAMNWNSPSMPSSLLSLLCALCSTGMGAEAEDLVRFKVTGPVAEALPDHVSVSVFAASSQPRVRR